MQRLIHFIVKTLFSTLAVHSVRCAPIAHIPESWIYSHGYQIAGFKLQKKKKKKVSVSMCGSDFFWSHQIAPTRHGRQMSWYLSNSFSRSVFNTATVNMDSSDIIHCCLWSQCFYHTALLFFHFKKNVGVTLWQMSKLKYMTWITSWDKSVDP